MTATESPTPCKDWKKVALYELEHALSHPIQPGGVQREVFVQRGQLFLRAKNPNNVLANLRKDVEESAKSDREG